MKSLIRVASHSDRIGVVVVTHNRGRLLLETLERLRTLPEQPQVLVVDNASTDGTADAVRELVDDRLSLLALSANRGAVARNLGIGLIGTELVALCDDDSWFVPGALARACEHFASHPSVGLLAASVVLGSGEIDDTTRAMRASPLGTRPGSPGPDVLGFMACGAVVRRRAVLEVGGFEAKFETGSEATLLALDLVAAGWQVVHAPDVVAIHERPGGPRTRRCRGGSWSGG